MIRNYDYVTKTYRNASPRKKAEILSSLSATQKPKPIRLKGRGVYQDFDGLDENVYYDEDKILKLVDKDKFLKLLKDVGRLNFSKRLATLLRSSSLQNPKKYENFKAKQIPIETASP